MHIIVLLEMNNKRVGVCSQEPQSFMTVGRPMIALAAFPAFEGQSQFNICVSQDNRGNLVSHEICPVEHTTKDESFLFMSACMCVEKAP